MPIVRFILDDEIYLSKDADTVPMCILGYLFSCEIGCYEKVFQEWGEANKSDPSCGFTNYFSGNIVRLEEVDEKIVLTDMFPAEGYEAELIMTKIQYLQLLNDWKEIVCKTKPREVLIKYENDTYTIEVIKQ